MTTTDTVTIWIDGKDHVELTDVDSCRACGSNDLTRTTMADLAVRLDGRMQALADAARAIQWDTLDEEEREDAISDLCIEHDAVRESEYGGLLYLDIRDGVPVAAGWWVGLYDADGRTVVERGNAVAL